MENSFRDEKPLFEIKVDETVKHYFLDMSRWVMFLSIIGFISVGIMVLVAIIGSVAMFMVPNATDFAGIGAAAIFFIYIILAVVCFYPAFAMVKFATLIKPALYNSDQDKFNRALKYLKDLFKYYGIMVIIWLIFTIGFYAFFGLGRIM